MGVRFRAQSSCIIRLMGLLQYLFLRLYGADLERRSRSGPAIACDDAITQTILMLLVPCSAVITLVVAAVFAMSAEEIRNLGKGVVLATVILLTVVTWKFKRYADIPESAVAFRARGGRRLTWTLFYLMPLMGIALLVLAFRLSRS
jgi:hypothetical protein